MSATTHTANTTRTATTTDAPAVQVALAYFRAWTAKDMDRAMTYIADDMVCDSPAGRLEGVDAYRAFMQPFTQILTVATLLAAYGDETTALLCYDTATIPVRSAPACELLTVHDSRITASRFIFDRLPFQAAREGN